LRSSISRLAAAPAAGALLALAALSAGCTPSSEELRAELVSGQRRGRYIPLEFIKQEPNRCGSAALGELLAHWKVANSSEEQLAKEVYSKSLKGTLNFDLANAARRRELVVRSGRSCLKELHEAIESGYPAVVMITLSPHVLKRKHFMIIKGVDLERGYLMADDGRRPDRVLRPRPFRKDWRSSKFWALYCWPAEKPPTWAASFEELQAGVILERRGRADAAVEAYGRALGKDPKMWEARFNLGNVSLARGRRTQAFEHYRAALTIKPEEPDVLNNLACALLAGKTDLVEAERLARKAAGAAGEGTAERVRALHTLGLVIAARGGKEEARRTLNRALEEGAKVEGPGLAEAIRADLKRLGK
jgi:tetratricopeptide (TPR) repeat protein